MSMFLAGSDEEMPQLSPVRVISARIGALWRKEKGRARDASRAGPRGTRNEGVMRSLTGAGR